MYVRLRILGRRSRGSFLSAGQSVGTSGSERESSPQEGSNLVPEDSGAVFLTGGISAEKFDRGLLCFESCVEGRHTRKKSGFTESRRNGTVTCSRASERLSVAVCSAVFIISISAAAHFGGEIRVKPI